MELVYINPLHPQISTIKIAIDVLRKGGIIVYPTDTVYALGCDASNKRALARIFKIKKRPLNKALPLIAGSAAMVKKFCRVNPVEARLMKKYWPGSLTLILGLQKRYIDIFSAIAEKISMTVAIRVPDCQIARLLSQKLGRPIVSTSANISGKPSCYSVGCVLKQLPLTSILSPKGRGEGEGVNLILDAGRLPKRKPSTIAKVVDGAIEILRAGSKNLDKEKHVIPSEARNLTRC